MKPSPIPLLVICGPTASGKTGLAVGLALNRPIEVISADSRQVFRHMNIGTAKATIEEQRQVPHHLIDVRDPDEEYSVADYVRDARAAIEEIWERQKLPVVVGGTGLYIRALLGGIAPAPPGEETLRRELAVREEREPGSLYRELEQVDPEQAARIHPNNRVRIIRALEVYRLSGKRLSDLQREHAFADTPYRSLMIGLNPGMEALRERIQQRSQAMVAQGLIEETRWLMERYPLTGTALQTLGYAETVAFLQGKMNREALADTIALHTRQYAKRQVTWFKREPDIYWLASSDVSGNIQKLIENFYEN